MTRFEYIAALKQALAGLPQEVIATTVADYERRIAEASAAGQSEDEIIAGLDDPQKVAAACRAAAELKTFKQHKTPVNFVRMFFSFIGLMVFDLFLVIPAIVYSALLFASYVVALAVYGGGIMVTAAGLAGVNEISLDQPYHLVSIESTPTDAGQNKDHTIIEIGKSAASADIHGHAPASASASTAPASSATSAGSGLKIGDDNSSVIVNSNGVRVTDGSDQVRISGDGSNDGAKIRIHENDGGDEHDVNIDIPGIRIHSPGDSYHAFFSTADLGESRASQVAIGIGMILIGILSFLLCLAISKYTLIGILRLAQMEFAVLKNA